MPKRRSVYADAYRKAAKARGVLPREMQSITWEEIRGLYPKEIKQPKFKEQINNLFKLYENAKITINELRTKVFEKAGGIDPLTWFGPGAALEAIEKWANEEVLGFEAVQDLVLKFSAIFKFCDDKK